MNNDTICALATTPGGAIGIIRTSGPDAISITDAIFQGKHRLTEVKPYTMHFGEIRDNGTLSYRLPDDALSAIRGCLDA